MKMFQLLGKEKERRDNKVNPWIKWSKIKGNLNTPQNTTYSVVWKKTYLPRKKMACIMLVNVSSIKRRYIYRFATLLKHTPELHSIDLNT